MNQEELKQRLIELLEQDPCPSPYICDAHCPLFDTNCFSHRFADHLIANGVTIRERGEWFLSIHHPCGVDYGRPHLVCSKCGNIEWEFKSPCPHCGADMRGVTETEKGGVK